MDLQLVGLLFDLAGILVLGLPPLVRFVDEIAGQSGTHWGYNPKAVRILSAARVDLAAGSILLALGFGMQAAAILCRDTLSTAAALAVLLSLPAAGLLYFCWLRGYVSAALAARVEAKLTRIASQEPQKSN